MRDTMLKCEGITGSPIAVDLEHVFDDKEGPYSHPNLGTGASVDVMWMSDFVQGTATWGTVWASDGEW